MKGNKNKILTLLYYLQLTKTIQFYNIGYPPNADLYIEEMKNLVDMEFASVGGIVRFFDPNFDVGEWVSGVKNNTISAIEEA